jgi:hypothetical protein
MVLGGFSPKAALKSETHGCGYLKRYQKSHSRRLERMAMYGVRWRSCQGLQKGMERFLTEDRSLFDTEHGIDPVNRLYKTWLAS